MSIFILKTPQPTRNEVVTKLQQPTNSDCPTKKSRPLILMAHPRKKTPGVGGCGEPQEKKEKKRRLDDICFDLFLWMEYNLPKFAVAGITQISPMFHEDQEF